MASPQGFSQRIWLPTLQFVRFRKINIQKPRPPFFERAKVLELCKPILPRYKKYDPNVPLYETCDKVTGYTRFPKKVQENPYEVLLAKEMLGWLQECKLTAFFHCNNMSGDENFDILLLSKKNKMWYRLYSKYTAEIAVKGTQYEVIMQLFKSRTSLIFCKEPNVNTLMRMLKKTPSISLLAGIVEGKLLSRSEMEAYANLPDLQTARAGLVSVLNLCAQNVVDNLNYHQTTLVQRLQLYSEKSDQQNVENKDIPSD